MALNVNSLEGNEIADDYTRKVSSQSRWGLTWDVFKSCFGKLVLINIFVLITFVPGIAVVFFRSWYINVMGLQYPFNANTGLGYPAYPGTAGLTEQIYFSADVLFYPLLIAAGLIASIGISGAAYSIRKLVNTQGQFSVKGFFHGIRVCYFNTALPVTIFMLFMLGTLLIGSWKDMTIAAGASSAGPITAYVFAIIATVLVGIYCAWLLAVGVSFRVKLGQLFKNAFVLLIGSPIQTLFMAAFALIPVWLYLIGTTSTIIQFIAYAVFIFFGFSFILIVWMSFSQWVFDMYITPNVKAAKEDADSKKTPKQLALEKEEEDKRVAMELLAAGKSELIGKPILPIQEKAAIQTLGITYTRADLNKISENRDKLKDDIAAYEAEHMSDPVYAEYNKLFADREKALQTEGKKSKKKKVSADNLLK